MNYCLIGYGKMGKIIEEILKERGHDVIAIITRSNMHVLPSALQNADMAIEFTTPESAVSNIIACLDAKVPVVCGSTGWIEKWPVVKNKLDASQGSLLYASNFSIGVNIFFAVNRHLARIMNKIPDYSLTTSEWHHVHKLDKPSGTMITLLNDIIAESSIYSSWKVNEPVGHKDQIPVNAYREGEIIGTHEVKYSSDIDEITLSHKAFNRKGFAMGAVLASEWLHGKTGNYTMSDMLGLY